MDTQLNNANEGALKVQRQELYEILKGIKLAKKQKEDYIDQIKRGDRLGNHSQRRAELQLLLIGAMHDETFLMRSAAQKHAQIWPAKRTPSRMAHWAQYEEKILSLELEMDIEFQRKRLSPKLPA